MLQTDVALRSGAVYRGPSVAGYRSKGRISVSNFRSLVKVTWSSVELAGAELADEPFDFAVSQVVEALRLAKSNDKEELIIANIAPFAMVGSAEVSEVQASLEKVVTEAFDRLGDERPEIRLSLRGSEYDLRCYLGRIKPTDYVFDAED